MNWNITAGRPVYVQLIEQLELALVAGEFPPGSRIPPVRELAADAGVNPNTMQRALQELEGRGLLQAQRTGRTHRYRRRCRPACPAPPPRQGSGRGISASDAGTWHGGIRNRSIAARKRTPNTRKGVTNGCSL